MGDTRAGRLLRELVRGAAGAADGDQVLARAAGLLLGPLADWVIADRLADPDLVVRVAALGLDGPLALPAGLGPAGGNPGRGPGAPRRAPAACSRGSRPAPARCCTCALPSWRRSPRQRTRGCVRRPSWRRRWAAGRWPSSAPRRAAGFNGVLAVGGTCVPFSRQELELLRDVGLQVGLALDAARLLRSQREVSRGPADQPAAAAAAGARPGARPRGYQPAAQGLDVGGDWYDAFRLPDGALALVIGDTTGHDTSSASRMAELRNALRAPRRRPLRAARGHAEQASTG